MLMPTIVLPKKRTCAETFHRFKPLVENLVLLMLGSLVFVFGMNAVMIPAKLFSGGLTGIAILLAYAYPWMNVGVLYLLLNIPLIMIGWLTISKRFVGYTLFGTFFFALAARFWNPPEIYLNDTLLASLLAGVICGAGSGLILRSLGSAGGLDILSIYLNKHFGLRIGTTVFAANAAIIMAGAYFHNLQAALYSIILLFISGSVINTIVSGFNARMALIVVSDSAEPIAREILQSFNRGVTFLDGQGGFSHRPKKVILSVTTLTELPKIKEMVFSHDPQAFVIINNTLEVLGQRHGRLRQY